SNHLANSTQCQARSAVCRRCNKRGHFARVYKDTSRLMDNKKQEESSQLIKKIILQVESDNSNSNRYPECTITINNRAIRVYADSCSPFTIINSQNLKVIEKENGIDLSIADIYPKGYNRDPIYLKGMFTGIISFKGRSTVGKIYVVEDGSSLLGWQHQKELGIKLDLNNPDQVICVESLNSGEPFIHEFPEIFSGKLGLLKNFQHKIKIKPRAKAVAHKTRPIPHLLKNAVKEELNRLENLGIIQPVDCSEWLAPIVVAKKSNGKDIRLCVDLRDLNRNIWVERYPLPRIHEVLSTMGKAAYFSVLDLSNAYHQIELHPDSKWLTAFTTPFGSFMFNRMPFGLASAAAVFQKVIQNILGDLPNTLCFQDDVLVYGVTEEEHNERLRAVLLKLKMAGLTLRSEKCQLGVGSVEYLGHIISKDGFKPKFSLVDAVKKADPPKNKDELRSFLGLAEFMSKYVKTFSSISHKLRELLKNHAPFIWLEDHNSAFEQIKLAIVEAPHLSNFDHNRKTILTTDASKLGLGAALSQIVDGEERIIAFASKALNDAESNYSVIEREALVVFWAVKHFKFFLWGTQFILRTDHKPLVYVFSTKGFSNSTPRIARWILGLENFCFNV
ncbi:hypothetical protein NDU88_007115, partial [Pleurodeles waltl]